MRVLHIEDDALTAKAVELMLKSEGFNVFSTDEGEDGADLAKLYDYDVILLDLGLPDISGLEVLRQVRAAKVSTPIVILTGHSSLEAKVAAFSAGADDYLTKPFHKEELVSRMHAVIRRSKGHPVSVIEAGGLRLDLTCKTLRADGVPIHITGREYQLLETLMVRRGAVVPKQALMDAMYGGMDEPELKIIDVYVCKIRNKLKAAGLGKIIESVWGRGYSIPNPDASVATAPGNKQ